MKRATATSIMVIVLMACSGSMLFIGVGSNRVNASITSPNSAYCSYPGNYYSAWVIWDCYGAGSNLYTCGSTHRCSPEDYDITLVKWDLNGRVLWNHSYGSPNEDVGEGVWANTSCIFTFGYTTRYPYSTTEKDFLLVKWDTAGNMLWNHTWGGHNEEIGYSVWGDNNYIYTCGSTESYGAGRIDLALIKWDADGNIVWNRTWGGTEDDYGFDVWGDGNYIYTSGKSDSWSSSFDIALVKWYTNGSIVWTRTWGGPYEERGSSVCGNGTQLYTSGVIYNSSGWSDLVLVKWDADGTVLWNRTWGGPYEDRAYKMWVNETSIYTCGWTQDKSYEDLALSIIKWDANGNRLWNRTWDGAGLPLPLESSGSDCCWDGDTSFEVRGLAVWGSGSFIYTCGCISGYPPHYADVVVAKWDLQGNFYWAETWGTPCDAPDCGAGHDPHDFIFILILIGVTMTVLGLILGLSYRARVSRQAPPRGRIPEQPLPRSMKRSTSVGESPATPAQPRGVTTRSGGSVSSHRFCYNCGAEHPPGDDFCMYCGASLRDV